MIEDERFVEEGRHRDAGERRWLRFFSAIRRAIRLPRYRLPKIGCVRRDNCSKGKTPRWRTLPIPGPNIGSAEGARTGGPRRRVGRSIRKASKQKPRRRPPRTLRRATPSSPARPLPSRGTSARRGQSPYRSGKVNGMDQRSASVAQQVKSRPLEAFDERLVALYVVGSHARSDFHDESDLDLVAILDNHPLPPYVERLSAWRGAAARSAQCKASPARLSLRQTELPRPRRWMGTDYVNRGPWPQQTLTQNRGGH